jgi:catechol 2,3-dioxygenase-like lactoylglutathione lyase family enzyme
VSFRKISAVVLLVSNVKRSINFYKNILGLPVKKQSKDWTEFFNDGTVLALHPAKKKDELKSGSSMLIGFMVNDLDFSVKQLKKKKVKFFKQPKKEPFGKHTIILDPDGHLISIAELKEKSTEGFDLLGLVGTE